MNHLYIAINFDSVNQCEKSAIEKCAVYVNVFIHNTTQYSLEFGQNIFYIFSSYVNSDMLVTQYLM